MNTTIANQTAGYVTRGDLHVATELAAFLEDEALPGTGVDGGSLLGRPLAASSTSSAPRNRALLERRAELQAQIDAWHLARGRAARPRGLQGLPRRRSATSPPEGGPSRIETDERRPGDRHGRRAAARRADHQRPLRAQRRQRPLGQPLRLPLRHRRHGQPAARRRLRPRPRRPRRRAGAGLPRRGLPARAAPATPTPGATTCRAAPLPRRRHAAGSQPEKFVGYRGDPRRAGRRCCSATTACTSSSSSTAPT